MCAFRYEQTDNGQDLVFDGWENGIGPSPFTGLQTLRLVNIQDSPGELFVNYDLVQQYTPPGVISGIADSGADTITYTANLNPFTGFYDPFLNATPVMFGTVVNGISKFTVYYASVLTFNFNNGAGSFQIMTNIADAVAGTNAVNITAIGLVTFSAVGPVFSGFAGQSGNIAPYPATFTDTSANAFQFMGDSTGDENGDPTLTTTFPGTGNLWYYVGIGDLQPGWTLIPYGTALQVASVDTGAETITMPAGTTIATGTAITFKSTTTLPSPLVAGTTYYAINTSATAFKVATSLANALANTAINLTTTGSGTITVFLADTCNGLAAWNGYVFVFRPYQIDVLKISNFTWTIGWQINSTSLPLNGAALSHRAISSAVDNKIFFCNGNVVGSIAQNVNKIFDPADATTYNYQPASVQLPSAENAISLTTLGSIVYIGGIFNTIYSWDGAAQLYTFSLQIPEQNISEMVTVNTTIYIFAGYRGRIYHTNGSSAALFKKLPDQTTGVIQPFIYWKCATYDRDTLMFSTQSFDNAGSRLGSIMCEAGIWCIDLDTSTNSAGTSTVNSSLRQINIFSVGVDDTYTNMFSPFILPIARSASGGSSFVCGWTFVLNDTTHYSGFDGFVFQAPVTEGGTPDGAFIRGGAQVVTDLARVGSNLTPKTFSQVEFTLSAPLMYEASANLGESILLEARNNFNGTFVTVGQTTATAANSGTIISATFPVTFENYIFLQIRATLYSIDFTANPSYVRLRDIRAR